MPPFLLKKRSLKFGQYTLTYLYARTHNVGACTPNSFSNLSSFIHFRAFVLTDLSIWVFEVSGMIAVEVLNSERKPFLLHRSDFKQEIVRGRPNFLLKKVYCIIRIFPSALFLWIEYCGLSTSSSCWAVFVFVEILTWLARGWSLEYKHVLLSPKNITHAFSQSS